MVAVLSLVCVAVGSVLFSDAFIQPVSVNKNKAEASNSVTVFFIAFLLGSDIYIIQ